MTAPGGSLFSDAFVVLSTVTLLATAVWVWLLGYWWASLPMAVEAGGLTWLLAADARDRRRAS